MVDIRADFNKQMSVAKVSKGNSKDDIEAIFSDIKKQSNIVIGDLVNGSIIGINANKVEDMTGTIVKVISDIEKHLQEIEITRISSQTFDVLEIQDAYKTYINGIKDVCSSYTTQLQKLVAELNQIKAYYVAVQSKQASTL